MMEFSELAKLEPRLLPLLEDATEHHKILKSYWQRNRYWYHVLKPQMFDLVGFGSNHLDARLHTTMAYDTCYNELYHELTGEWISGKPRETVKQ